MRQIFFFWLVFFPLLLFGRDHEVPAGTDGNRLVMSLQNTTESDFEGVQIAVQSIPEWLLFNQLTVSVGDIAPGEAQEAAFEFSILKLQTDEIGKVEFEIRDANGRILGNRTLTFHSVLTPGQTHLDPPYPNPANPEASIRYTLQTESHVSLKVFNILGQRVRQLIDEKKPAGFFSINWDGKNDNGLAVSSGVYVVQLTTKENGTNRVRHFSSKLIIQK